MKLVEKVHRKQRTRHLVANKLTAALTALRHLREGGVVGLRLVQRAIDDLEAIMRSLDKKEKSR